MLVNLKIKNFRMLAEVQLARLARVNLVVGKNNVGKSSLLEAMRIHASRGNPQVLLDIAASHDESAAFSLPSGAISVSTPFVECFHGRTLPGDDGAGDIYIGDLQDSQFVRIGHRHYLDEDEILEPTPNRKLLKTTRRIVLQADLASEASPPVAALAVQVAESKQLGWISLAGGAGMGAGKRNEFEFWQSQCQAIPLGQVSTQLAAMDQLAQLWDKIAATPMEATLHAAMQIIEPDFQALRFVDSQPNQQATQALGFDPQQARFAGRERRTAVVQLRGTGARLPLRSMGEGMLRVLQLILEMVSAKGGMVLIDEFENGLHWSVQEKIWDMIFTLANELDIQVFATTHSDDAIRAFASVAHAREPDMGMLLRLVRQAGPTGAGQTIAIPYDRDMLYTASQTETEVR